MLRNDFNRESSGWLACGAASLPSGLQWLDWEAVRSELDQFPTKQLEFFLDCERSAMTALLDSTPWDGTGQRLVATIPWDGAYVLGFAVVSDSATTYLISPAPLVLSAAEDYSAIAHFSPR